MEHVEEKTRASKRLRKAQLSSPRSGRGTRVHDPSDRDDVRTALGSDAAQHFVRFRIGHGQFSVSGFSMGNGGAKWWLYLQLRGEVSCPLAPSNYCEDRRRGENRQFGVGAVLVFCHSQGGSETDPGEDTAAIGVSVYFVFHLFAQSTCLPNGPTMPRLCLDAMQSITSVATIGFASVCSSPCRRAPSLRLALGRRSSPFSSAWRCRCASTSRRQMEDFGWAESSDWPCGQRDGIAVCKRLRNDCLPRVITSEECRESNV